MEGDEGFRMAGETAIELAGRAQRTTAGLAATRGGISGSVPLTGGYLPFCYPNWAAKFYLDGLLALRGVATPAPTAWIAPAYPTPA